MRGRALGAPLWIGLACVGLAAAGCGSDTPDAAAPVTSTPPTSVTPPPPAPAQGTAPAPPPEPVGPGDPVAGRAVFVESCDTCHAGIGTRNYIGPKLSGRRLTEALIRDRVVNGKSPMPAGLVQGQDLADVVAFVRSIQ